MDFQDFGLIDYEKALALQEKYVEDRYAENITDTIIFCRHPPVVTLGRSTQESDIQGWTGDTFEVRRGGRATYHGPNQLVIYPIINLNQNKFKNLKNKDVMCFLTSFESAVLNSLKLLGFENVYLKEDTDTDVNGKKLLNRGLWCDSKKVAAFGIAVRKWVTYHGCAINLYEDKNAFHGIQPCGYKTTDVGSLDQIKDFDPDSLKAKLKIQLESFLS